MATAVEPRTARDPEGERRFLLTGVGWDGYEALLAMIGGRSIRVTYDRGDAELMSPRYDHESFKKLIARLVEEVAVGLGLPCEPAGSTTFKKKVLDKGLEPDECYYLANAERVVGLRAIDLDAAPPPDLAVEIEITHGALDRMGIYAALGVPEVWRFDGEALRIEQLQADGTYRAVDASPGLPVITRDEIVRWVHLGRSIGKTPWALQLRAWVRDELRPRHANR